VHRPSETLRFGDFELDVAGCELRRLGRRVKLGRQAMDVLILLVHRRSELVLRSDIVERLWGKDVFVDVETGVNTAISKIRQALRDSADAPTFVETVPARGYRFVATVDVIDRARSGRLPVSPVESPSEAPPPAGSRTSSHMGLFAGLAMVALIAGLVLWTRPGLVSGGRVTLAVLPFDNVGADPANEYLATGLTEETGASRHRSILSA
jgi:DNA-binding winged helix-turn-helix (wHTH) protein